MAGKNEAEAEAEAEVESDFNLTPLEMLRRAGHNPITECVAILRRAAASDPDDERDFIGPNDRIRANLELAKLAWRQPATQITANRLSLLSDEQLDAEIERLAASNP